MSAEDDQLWASSSLTEIAERRLRDANFPHFHEHVRYPHAGHFMVLPPNLPQTSNSARHQIVPMTLAFGGSPEANAHASADMWPRVVSFLGRLRSTQVEDAGEELSRSGWSPELNRGAAREGR